MGPARKSLCMAEKEQLSNSSQEQGPSAYDEDRKALLVLAFMPKLEIEAFLADQGFNPPTFDKDDPRFNEKLDALKLYMVSKQMAFEDLTQRFPAMNNTFSKPETQQKMTYAQVANSQEEQIRFFIEHAPRAQLIANSKPGQPVALLPRPSAPPSSVISSTDDSDQESYTHHKKKRKRTERSPSESSNSSSSSKSSRHHKTHSRRRKRRRHSASTSSSSRSSRSKSPRMDQPPSRYLIDAYLMCLTAGARLRSIRFAHPSQGQSRNQGPGNYRPAPAPFPPAHDNGQYYGRRNNYRERGHRQPNDNQRAQNRERRAEQNPQ